MGKFVCVYSRLKYFCFIFVIILHIKLIFKNRKNQDKDNINLIARLISSRIFSIFFRKSERNSNICMKKKE